MVFFYLSLSFAGFKLITKAHKRSTYDRVMTSAYIRLEYSSNKTTDIYLYKTPWCYNEYFSSYRFSSIGSLLMERPENTRLVTIHRALYKRLIPLQDSLVLQ